MKPNKHILWLTQSALFIALLISWQFVSRNIPGTLATGTGVNFILVIAVMLGVSQTPLRTGLTVAAVSPVMAFSLGVTPLPSFALVPFIAAGNIALVMLWSLIGRRQPRALAGIIALGIAAGVKCGVLYLGVVRVAIPMLLDLPAPAVRNLSAAFGITQLFTALMGGALAFATLPLLNRATRVSS